PAPASSALRLPFVGGPFTIPDGPNQGLHTGVAAESVDFELVPTDHDVLAAAPGTVILAATGTGCSSPVTGVSGKLVVIQHGTIFAYYAHLSSILVSQGQVVTTGTVIGKQGMTGCSGYPHLHFEARTGVDSSHPVNTGTAYSIRSLDGITWV